MADITPFKRSFQVSARIVDVETAQVIAIGDSYSPLKTANDLKQVSDQVVRIMFGEKPKSVLKISVGAGGFFAGNFGCGLDIDLSLKTFLRSEIMYGFRTANELYIEDNDDGETKTGHGLTVKVGAGVRF